MKARELTKSEVLANIKHANEIKQALRNRKIAMAIKQSGFLGQSVLPNGFNIGRRVQS